jgi:hypothetical protein
VPPDTEKNLALWGELMAVRGSVEDLWRRVREIAPKELIDLTSFALILSGEMLGDGSGSVLDRRRALLLAQLCAHRVVFDLMGLAPSPDADVMSSVSRLFF